MDDNLKRKISDDLITECVNSLLRMAKGSNITAQEILGEGAATLDSRESTLCEENKDCCSEEEDSPKPEVSQSAAALKSDVYFFTFEILQKDISLQEMVLNSDTRGIAGRVAFLFLKKFKEARRTEPKDTSCDSNAEADDRSTVKWFSPYHFYFRHMRTVLHNAGKAGEIGYKIYEMPINKSNSKKPIPYYSCVIDASQPFLPHCYTGIRYKDWPCQDIDWRKLKRKPYMLDVARFFYEEMKIITSDDFFIPVRELVNFIEEKYPLFFLSELTESSFQNDTEGESEPFSIDALPYEKRTEDSPFQKQDNNLLRISIEETAANCCADMSVDEKILLVMSRSGANLKEMAARIGYKSQTSASGVLDSAIETVKRHWVLWGPSAGDGPEWMRYYFKTVIELCMKQCRIYSIEDLSEDK